MFPNVAVPLRRPLSLSTRPLQVSCGLPIRQHLSIFHRKAYLVVLVSSFLIVWPILLRLLQPTVFSTIPCRQRCQRFSFHTTCSHFVFVILPTYEMVKVWDLLTLSVVIFHVPNPQREMGHIKSNKAVCESSRTPCLSYRVTLLPTQNILWLPRLCPSII